MIITTSRIPTKTLESKPFSKCLKPQIDVPFASWVCYLLIASGRVARLSLLGLLFASVPVVLNDVLSSVLRVASHDVRRRFVLKI